MTLVIIDQTDMIDDNNWQTDLQLMLPGMLSQVRCWPPLSTKITIIKNSVWLLPAIDASRSVNTSVVAASVFNKALVDVFAFELAFVQSGIGKTFLQCNSGVDVLGNVHVACFDISQPPAFFARALKATRQICARTWKAGLRKSWILGSEHFFHISHHIRH